MQRCLDGGGGVQQVDQGETELQPDDLTGKQQHFVQQREGQPVDQPHGQLSQQSRKADRGPGSGQGGHERRQQKGHGANKDRLGAHGERSRGEERSEDHHAAYPHQGQRHCAQKCRPIRHRCQRSLSVP